MNYGLYAVQYSCYVSTFVEITRNAQVVEFEYLRRCGEIPKYDDSIRSYPFDIS